jgi:hypothetical protein
MKNQRFFEEDWDYAIILDCARFDVFSKVYDDYFDGSLEKRRSNASATPEWVEKNFSGRRNINYFSTNPFINGKGIKLNEFDYIPERYHTNPSKHLMHIVDVWENSWNSEVGTVLPEDLNSVFKDRINNLANRRTVLHYMQPHKPFIGHGKSRMENMKRNSVEKIHAEDTSLLPESITERLSYVVSKLENSETAMKLGLMMSLNPSSFIRAAVGDTDERMKQHHKENMRRAMENAKEIIKEVDGKVIITSDHGEAFGEKGVWGHHIETYIPPLVEVPWLEVEKVK